MPLIIITRKRSEVDNAKRKPAIIPCAAAASELLCSRWIIQLPAGERCSIPCNPAARGPPAPTCTIGRTPEIHAGRASDDERCTADRAEPPSAHCPYFMHRHAHATCARQLGSFAVARGDETTDDALSLPAGELMIIVAAADDFWTNPMLRHRTFVAKPQMLLGAWDDVGRFEFQIDR